MSIFKKIQKSLFKGMAVAALSVIAVFMASCGGEESYRQIKVYEIEGNATVTRDETMEVEPYVNMLLQNKDVAETVEESYLQLQMDEDKYILLEPSTKIQIEAEGDSADSKTKINLLKGAVVNRIDEKLSANSTYEVNTPNSTMAVRGTTFRVEISYDENGESYTTLTVCEGKVECRLIEPDGTISEEVIVLEKGEQIQIHGDDALTEYLGDKETVDFEKLKDKVLGFIGYMEDKEEIETETETEIETETEMETETETETKSEAENLPESEKTETPVNIPANSESEDSGGWDSGQGSEQETPSETETTKPESFTVTFKDASGNVFATQTVKNGSTPTAPLLKPTQNGSWSSNISDPVTADTEITWTAN